MKTKDKILLIVLVLILLIASHYDYVCQQEDREAEAICRQHD